MKKLFLLILTLPFVSWAQVDSLNLKNKSIDEMLKNRIPNGAIIQHSIPEIKKIGSVIIPTKTKFLGTVCAPSIKNHKEPLYVVDGEITNLEKISISFTQENIKSIKVVKGKEALSKYGQKGNFGVIEIETKDGNGITEYDLAVLDLGYESFLKMQPSSGNYSLSYLQNRNQRYVSLWNQRVLTRDPNIYEMQIDYDSKTFYGLEFEHKLFMFFKFMEKKYSISML